MSGNYDEYNVKFKVWTSLFKFLLPLVAALLQVLWEKSNEHHSL